MDANLITVLAGVLGSLTGASAAMQAIELLGTRVAPLVRTALVSETVPSPLRTNSQYERNGGTTNIAGTEFKTQS
jgi:hypothetical protein